MKLGAVILAGGYSSRMGGFKPLLELNGKSMLLHCIHQFQSVEVEQIVVVTGHRGSEIQQETKESGAKVVHNLQYADGMFSSVRAAMLSLGEVDGFFVLPVDIPLVRTVTLETLVSQYDGEHILYPAFLGERGHPPLIPASIIPAILDHDGNGGLQGLLERLPGRDIPLWDKSILMDADTPDDFAALKQHATCIDVGSRAEAQVLAELYMSPRGVAHGLAVAGIGCRLGEALNMQGMKLDIQCIYNGGLLHDIAKGQPDHEVQGGNLLKRLGLTRIAEIVASHRDVGECNSCQLTEKEIVFLADKLVRGTRQMSVEERFNEKLVKYADDPEAITAIRSRLSNALSLKELVEQRLGVPINTVLQE